MSSVNLGFSKPYSPTNKAITQSIPHPKPLQDTQKDVFFAGEKRKTSPTKASSSKKTKGNSRRPPGSNSSKRELSPFSAARKEANQLSVGSRTRRLAEADIAANFPEPTSQLANEIYNRGFTKAREGDQKALNGLVETRRNLDPDNPEHKELRAKLTKDLALLRQNSPTPPAGLRPDTSITDYGENVLVDFLTKR